jgi:hypothetical protein
MREHIIDVEPFQELAEHLPTNSSLRELSRRLGRSHEYWRGRIARESAGLIDAVEVQLRAGRVPLFEVPYGQPLEEYAAALTLATWATEQLRARGWNLRARGVRYRGLNGVAFAIEFEEEQE